MNLNSDIMNNDQPALSCHVYFNSTKDHNMGYYDHDHHQLYQSHQHISDDYHNHGYNNNNHGGSTYEIKNKVDHQSGLKLTLWKNEDHGHPEQNTTVQHDSVKWMSSKMRLMKKMKNQPDRVTLKIKTSASKKINKLEDQTYSLETDSNNSSYSPIRVCSDCNTTKTPLWRSGPKGPKSLCNACGIRQRKARRAMAAAAAAANGTTVAAASADHQRPASLKVKVQQHKGKNGHLKKRCKVAVNVRPTSEDGSTSKKRIGLEEFLINLSKNLSFHRVFPEDEKDAAILLMALSSGLVHG